MNPSVRTAIEKQAAHELFASHAYLAMACWCDVQHFSGYAAFYKLQADEERTHAQKLLDHLVARDIVPALEAIPAPPCTFGHINETAEAAFHLERANTAGIHAAYHTAVESADLAAQVMLHWFIAEQVEEEAWSDKLVAKTRQATCSGAITYLDRHIIKELRPEH